MKRNRSVMIPLASCLVALAALAGCTQQKTTAPRAKPAMAAEPAPKTVTRSGWPTHVTSGSTVWTAMAYPTGDPKTSAIGVEKGMPKEVRVGQPFEYELVVTNLTDYELSEVVVTDDLGENFKVTGSAPRAEAKPGGTLSWMLGTLGPKQSKTIRVSGTAEAEGQICSCASVSYNSLLCACIPVVQPELRLTKAGPAEVLRCDDIVYRFQVSNTGTGMIENVRITDELPAGLVSADGKRAITFEAGTLSPGASKPFTAKVTAQRAGRFENKATASGAGGITAASGVVATVVRQPILKIEKSCPNREFIGRPLNYEITVTNTGDGVARDAIIDDAIPSGLRFVSADAGGRFVDGKVIWSLGDLDPKATRTVTMRLSTEEAGTYRNTATAQAYCATPVSDSCQTIVTGIPAILLEVIDIEDPDAVGTTETYVITVTNQGSAAATSIRIVATLEANQEHVSNSGATRGTARGNQILFDPLASLAPKAKATWRVIVRNVKAGDVRFKVTMTSDELTRPVEETEATNVYE